MRMASVFLAASMAAGVAALAAGPASAQLPDTLQPGLNARIAAAHADLADAAADLVTHVGAFCAGDADRSAAADAYHAAADAFMPIQWAGIGIAIAFDRRFRLNFWPDDTNAISRQLAEAVTDQPPELLTPEGMADASVALQGLPALERLLFGQPLAEPGTYACDLAVAIAGSVSAVSTELADGWADPAGPMLAMDAETYLDHVLSGIYGHLELVGDRKIGRVAGPTLDEARPRRSEAWRSGRSLRNIALNLEAVEYVLFGSGGEGLLVDFAGTPAAEALAQLEVHISVARALAEPMRDHTMADMLATPEGHAALLDLRKAIDAIRQDLALSVYPALGLRVGFNSADGD